MFYSSLSIVSNISLYHYTPLSGLMGIVQNHCLFASDSRFLNDKSELKDAIYSIQNELALKTNRALKKSSRKLWRDITENLTAGQYTPLYIISFCREGDLLSMWRAYGGVAAVSIEFNDSHGHDFNLTRSSGFCPLAVLYEEKAKKFAIEKMISDINTDKFAKEIHEGCKTLRVDKHQYLTHKLIQAAATLKNISFHEEKEIRLVYNNSHSQFHNREHSALYVYPYEHRIGYAGITGYLKVGPKTGTLPIRRVIVGPHAEADRLKLSIKLFLSESGYPDVKVEISQAPLRLQAL